LAGEWPFWISPRQIKICPVSEKFMEYCERVYLKLHQEGFEVELDRSNNTLPKKIRHAELEHFNFILVCGQQEVDNGTVNVRMRGQDKKEPVRYSITYPFIRRSKCE